MKTEMNPAAVNGSGQIQISDWKPYAKNTLRGFFAAMLPSGMVLHGLTLHERNGTYWISFPAREWVNAQGEKQFSPIVDFRDRATGDRFRDVIFAALNRHLEKQP